MCWSWAGDWRVVPEGTMFTLAVQWWAVGGRLEGTSHWAEVWSSQLVPGPWFHFLLFCCDKNKPFSSTIPCHHDDFDLPWVLPHDHGLKTSGILSQTVSSFLFHCGQKWLTRNLRENIGPLNVSSHHRTLVIIRVWQTLFGAPSGCKPYSQTELQLVSLKAFWQQRALGVIFCSYLQNLWLFFS